MPKAISYIRFSSGQQEGGDSVRRQESMAKMWCEQRGIPLSPLTYRDLGKSAFKGKNAQAGMLRSFIEEAAKPRGLIEAGDYLIIEAFDRLSRLPAMEAYEIAKDILKQGVVIVTLNNHMEYSVETLKTDQGKMFTLFGDLYSAHNYSSNLSRRSKGAHERVRQTLLAGGKIKHKCPSWLTWDPVKQEYFINDQGEVVREIWKLRTQPNCGYTAIAAALNAREFKCHNKRGWEHFISRCFFHFNEAIGAKEVRKPNADTGKHDHLSIIEGYYPAVIDRTTFDQAMLNRKNETFWRTGKPPRQPFVNILTRLVKCTVCGESCKSYQSIKPKGLTRYLVCRNRRRNKTCPDGSTVRLDQLESRILDHIQNELAASELLSDKRIAENLDNASKQVQLQQLSVHELGKRAETLTANLADPDLNHNAKKLLQKKLNEVSDELAGAEKQLQDSRKHSAELQQALSVSEESLDKVRILSKSSKIADRKALRSAIAALIQKIVVQNIDQVAIHFRTGLVRELHLSRFARVGWGVVRLLDHKQLIASDYPEERQFPTLGDMAEKNMPSIYDDPLMD